MYCIHEMRKMNEWMKPVNECDRDGKIDGLQQQQRKGTTTGTETGPKWVRCENESESERMRKRTSNLPSQNHVYILPNFNCLILLKLL